MPRLTELEPRFVDTIPETLEEGILYVSEMYNTTIHLCPCGCKNKIVVPFNIGGTTCWWTYTREPGTDEITLSPSVGSFQIPCRSHYFITKNKILWC
jgi:hypothetical protein